MPKGGEGGAPPREALRSSYHIQRDTLATGQSSPLVPHPPAPPLTNYAAAAIIGKIASNPSRLAHHSWTPIAAHRIVPSRMRATSATNG
jgi:hypothetical protein